MKLYKFGAVLLAFAPCPAAIAQQGSATNNATEATASMAASGAFGAMSVLGETDLSKMTGRDNNGALVASATQRNTVANNSVVGTSTTGNVQITGNAFQNLQGLAVISANSGNNVAINSSMSVVVNLAPR